MNKSKMLVLAGALALGVSTSAFAINELQLTILDGSYQLIGTAEYDKESTVAPSNEFFLYALLKEGEDLDSFYYISAALWPKQNDDLINSLGYFSFNDTKYSVPNDMKYGVPPVDLPLTKEGNDLPTHDVYDTYFLEFEFKFDQTKLTKEFNAEDSTPQSDDPNTVTNENILSKTCNLTNEKCMYYQPFKVNVAELFKDYSIHFDLYKTDSGNITGDRDILVKAPFSHDAQSRYGGCTQENPEDCGKTRPQCIPDVNCPSIPEPNALALLGIGLLGLAGMNVRRRWASLKA